MKDSKTDKMNSTPGNSAAVRSTSVKYIEAGILGGVVSTLVLHPLDLLKTRLAGKQ